MPITGPFFLATNFTEPAVFKIFALPFPAKS